MGEGSFLFGSSTSSSSDEPSVPSSLSDSLLSRERSCGVSQSDSQNPTHHMTMTDLSRGVTLTAGLVMGCTSVTWVAWEGPAWEGPAWGVAVTKGTLAGTVRTHHTPINNTNILMVLQ